MTEYLVSLDEQDIEILANSIRQGPVLEIADGRAIRALNEELVARVDGVKIEIFANEHPPPHFRVKYQGSTANYTISECRRLKGSGEILKFEKNIEHWWKDNKKKLIEAWNNKRPSDCPVGKYRV